MKKIPAFFQSKAQFWSIARFTLKGRKHQKFYRLHFLPVPLLIHEVYGAIREL